MDRFPILRQHQTELGYRLSDEAIDRLARYRDLLIEWNGRFNLTSVTDPGEIETRLFLDSIAMLRLIRRSAGDGDTVRLVDVGAGAGFPGLPLKIVDPSITLVLIEATAKKVGFVQEVIRDLQLSDASAFHGRAEDLAHDQRFRAKFDVVTARAVARLPALIEICMPFAHVRGRGLFPKGVEIDEEIRDAARAARLVHCKILGTETVPLDEMAGTTFVVVEQIAKAPAQYPRRAGIPAKDPL